MRAQGWYRDPYGRHVDRWMSDGRPTALVRDYGAESYDPPPREDLCLAASDRLPVANPATPAAREPARLRDYGPAFIAVAVVAQLMIWNILLHTIFLSLAH